MSTPRRQRRAALGARTIVAWLAGGVIFFPIVWMVLTSFKSEIDAVASPPAWLFFHWTLENYREVQARSDYLHHALNSVLLAAGSTGIGLMLGVPAAWSLAFAPTGRTRGVLVWMLSTRMMPPVGILIPVYLAYRTLGLLDTRIGLIAILSVAGLPLVVWMLFTYFREIPRDILEAARMDGASTLGEIVHILMPLAAPGLASTALLTAIFTWNESFWTLNLSTQAAAPLTAFIASYSSPEGLFWGKLSAASVMAVAPIVILGWFSQKHLVRGLTFGAVK